MSDPKRAKIEGPHPPFPYLTDEHGREWDQDLCDVELVVEGTELPAHRCFLAKYSKVLKDCISAAAGMQAAVRHRIQIPLDDSVQAVTDTLELIYCGASSSSLHQLSTYPMDRCQAVVRLVDKYDMRVLAQDLSRYLCDYPHKTLWTTIEATISWAALAHAVHLPAVLTKCETAIAVGAKVVDLELIVRELPLGSALSILKHRLKLSVGSERPSICPRCKITFVGHNHFVFTTAPPQVPERCCSCGYHLSSSTAKRLDVTLALCSALQQKAAHL